MTDKYKNTIIIVLGSITWATGILLGYSYKDNLPKIAILTQPKQTPTVPPKVLEEIKDFRPFVQDIVKSYYKYPNSLYLDHSDFRGANFELYIGNGENYLRLIQPKFDSFGNYPLEKKYLWSLYENWRPNPED